MEWYETFAEKMRELEFVTNDNDLHLFVLTINGAIVLAILYVDDIILVSDSEIELNNVKEKLLSSFKMKDYLERKITGRVSKNENNSR